MSDDAIVLCCCRERAYELASFSGFIVCERYIWPHPHKDLLVALCGGKLCTLQTVVCVITRSDCYPLTLAEIFAGGGTHNPMKDYEVQQPPADSISKVAFSPNANYLIASSWDNNVSTVGRQGGRMFGA